MYNMCLCVAFVRRRGLFLKQIFILYNTLHTLWRARGGLVVTLQQMPEPTLHQSSPHSSEDEARLLCGRLKASRLQLGGKKGESHLSRIESEEQVFFCESSWNDSFLERETINLRVWCICVCVCVRARGNVTQNERSTVRERGEMTGISFPKRGHYIPNYIQPALCPTVPSSFTSAAKCKYFLKVKCQMFDL